MAVAKILDYIYEKTGTTPVEIGLITTVVGIAIIVAVRYFS